MFSFHLIALYISIYPLERLLCCAIHGGNHSHNRTHFMALIRHLHVTSVVKCGKICINTDEKTTDNNASAATCLHVIRAFIICSLVMFYSFVQFFRKVRLT